MKGVYLRVSESSVKPIAETLMTKKLRKEGYKVNKNPYITILPSVKSEVDFELPNFEPPQSIEVSGLDVEPNLENPKKIFLDVSEDMIIQLWRDELNRQISKDKLIGDMGQMKIVLLEREDETSIDPKVRDELINTIYDFNLPSTITGIELLEKAPEYLQRT